MIIKHSVKFYSEVWRHRNEIRHDPVKYKEFIIKWYHNVNEMIKEDNRPEVLKYARMQQLDFDQTEVAYIRQWIIGVMNMRKLAKVEKRNDIRQYFRIQPQN